MQEEKMKAIFLATTWSSITKPWEHEFPFDSEVKLSNKDPKKQYTLISLYK